MKRNWMPLLALALVFGSCSKSCKKEATQPPTGTGSTAPTDTQNAELKTEDTLVGTGAEAVAGKLVFVNYTGTLTDGTKFDSSYDTQRPFSFVLGKGEVIEGWEKGIVGMKVGGKRKLTIPGNMGYREAGVPGRIPANATLLFDVELVDVKEPGVS